MEHRFFCGTTYLHRHSSSPVRMALASQKIKQLHTPVAGLPGRSVNTSITEHTLKLLYVCRSGRLWPRLSPTLMPDRDAARCSKQYNCYSQNMNCRFHGFAAMRLKRLTDQAQRRRPRELPRSTWRADCNPDKRHRDLEDSTAKGDGA